MGGSGGKVRLYVSNIPYEIRWQDLKDMFKNEGEYDHLFYCLFFVPSYYTVK